MDPASLEAASTLHDLKVVRPTAEQFRGSSLMLSSSELAAIEGSGQRLRGELLRMVRALPHESRSVRTMAAFLDVDRNTCQRVISATQPSSNGCEAFLRLPGIKPLRQLIRQAKLHGIGADIIDGLSAAFNRHVAVFESFDQSHQRLKARVEATLTAGVVQADRTELDVRRLLYQDHTRLMRRSVRVQSLITAVVPHADDPEKLEQAWLRGLVGLSVDRGAMPVPVGTASTNDDLCSPARTAFAPLNQQTIAGERVTAVVRALSSNPAPTLTARASGGSQVLVIDPAVCGHQDAIDVALATRISHIETPKRIYHTSTVLSTPAARLVFDVYLHRSLARASVASCGVFQFTMSFSGDMTENWPFRLPGQYRLELLGQGLENAATDAWAAQSRATEYLFAQTGWNADDFVGHRLDIAYPLWGSSAYQWFDFTSPENEGRS